MESLSRDISLSTEFLAPGNGVKTYNNTCRGSADPIFINWIIERDKSKERGQDNTRKLLPQIILSYNPNWWEAVFCKYF